MGIGIRLLFSRHFYNKFSVPLYIAVGSRYMLEGQKLKRNVESYSSLWIYQIRIYFKILLNETENR